MVIYEKNYDLIKRKKVYIVEYKVKLLINTYLSTTLFKLIARLLMIGGNSQTYIQVKNLNWLY